MVTINAVLTDDDLQEVLDRSILEPVVLFKHSLTCSISSWARQRMMDLLRDGDPPVYEIVVQQARPLCREIADILEVRHESPQAIVIWRRQAVYDASHDGISANDIRLAIREITTTR